MHVVCGQGQLLASLDIVAVLRSTSHVISPILAPLHALHRRGTTQYGLPGPKSRKTLYDVGLVPTLQLYHYRSSLHAKVYW